MHDSYYITNGPVYIILNYFDILLYSTIKISPHLMGACEGIMSDMTEVKLLQFLLWLREPQNFLNQASASRPGFSKSLSMCECAINRIYT